MPFFRSKPKVIDAVQFRDEAILPRGVNTYFCTDTERRSFYVVTKQEQRVTVKVGEWIVDEGDGKHFYPIDDETFKGPKGYDPLES